MRADANNTLSPTSGDLLELMLAALPESPADFRQLCSTVKDWDRLLNLAFEHSVDSLIYHHMVKIGFELPARLKDRAQRWQMIKDLWQSHSEAALDETLRALASVSVPVVVMKGPVLAKRLYPNPHMRLSADLDLLVASADLDTATAALATIGYHAANESQARFLRKYHYHTILSRSCPPVVELHFRVSDGFGASLPAEEFLKRSLSYRTAEGIVLKILSPEDEVLHLSVHAAGHRFLRLSWLYDIKLLLLKHPDLDWTTLITRAEKLSVVAPVLFTCEVLREKLGVQIPKLNSRRFQKIRSRLATRLLSLIAKQPEVSRRSLVAKMAFTAVLCDGPRSAAGYLQRQLLLIVRRRAYRHFPRAVPEEWAY